MSGVEITGIDHLVLTAAFSTGVLGMRAERFGSAPVRWALHFGTQTFNLHEAGHER